MHQLFLAVLFTAWQTAHSCSSFLLNETFGPGCLSGRTMDFETDLGCEIGYMPKGTELTLLPLCQGAPSPKLTTKHAFAFLTSARSIIQSFHAVRGPRSLPEPNGCHGQCFRNPSRARLAAGETRVCVVQDLGVPADDVSQAISDGLNDQGLSVTVQWDYDVPGLPDATSCNIS